VWGPSAEGFVQQILRNAKFGQPWAAAAAGAARPLHGPARCAKPFHLFEAVRLLVCVNVWSVFKRDACGIVPAICCATVMDDPPRCPSLLMYFQWVLRLRLHPGLALPWLMLPFQSSLDCPSVSTHRWMCWMSSVSNAARPMCQSTCQVDDTCGDCCTVPLGAEVALLMWLLVAFRVL
jgi:hypothetical protein